VGSNGFLSYGASQPLTQAGVPAGSSYFNKIQGDTLLNGNMYVNGRMSFISNEAASTTVSSGSADASILSNGTGSKVSGQLQIVSKGTSDAGGNVANQASASLTLTNGLGNTHGLQVYEDQTVLSGGTQSTSMTLNDNSVTFANTATGGPVQLKGVADGTSDFDAVNYRQLKGLESSLSRGVAMAAALAGIPQVDQGKTFSLGLGAGTFNGQSAVSIGGSFRFRSSTIAKVAVSKSSGDNATGSAGVGFSW
ncbi:MAG: hypothetical protein HGA47_15185, partial [Zoogloea sp.]|nr:hypothetical protein [Zoogloea sp.]